jgi:hypothetical protein
MVSSERSARARVSLANGAGLLSNIGDLLLLRFSEGLCAAALVLVAM